MTSPHLPTLARLLGELQSGEAVTTLGTLITALHLDSEQDEKHLREQLYNLRIEGIIAFDRPLGRFSAIRRMTAPNS